MAPPLILLYFLSKAISSPYHLLSLFTCTTCVHSSAQTQESLRSPANQNKIVPIEHNPPKIKCQNKCVEFL